MPPATRLAFVIPRVLSGGVEMFLLRLAGALRDRGFDVEVITTEEPGEWFDRMAARVPTTQIPRGGWFEGCARPFRVGRQLAEGHYDVVFLNGDRLAQQSLAMLPDRTAAVPIVHTDSATGYRLAFSNAEAWNVLVGISPRICEVARQQLPGRPLVHIPHGVEMPDEASWRARDRLAEELRLVFVGRLVQSVKNIMLLPEVLQACLARGLDARASIVGDGPDREALELRVREGGLEDRVTLLGTRSPAEVYELLLRSHVLLLPSFTEGFPLVLLEAQACGCVPLASRLPGLTDAAVEDGVTGRLIAVGEVEGYVTALEGFRRGPAGWAEMSAAGHERIRRGFSVEHMTDAYEALIADLLAGRYPLPRSRRGRLPVDLALYWRECIPGWVRRLRRLMR